ncbi:MAG: type II toxin-antitoxin system VapC family toxin [Candidatus Binataceae bacterium]
MTGIDTNVLVRYLVQDDADQAKKAARFIANECSADAPGLINRIVMCELVWVLETAYGYPRGGVAFALEKILRTTQFRIEDHQEAWSSLREYQAGADFADALIAAVNRRLGCERTVTFDRRAGRRPGFVVL